jgi:uncharacterized membrane protein
MSNGSDQQGQPSGPGQQRQPNGADHLSIVTVAGAVAGGLGVIGFVTLAGGAVLWRRFGEMGLPADEAVALVPKSVLVSTGADFLLPAIGTAALMVVALVMIRTLSKTTDPAVSSKDRAVSLFWAWSVGILVALVETWVAFHALIERDLRFPAVAILMGIAAASGIVVGISLRYIRSTAAVALIAFVAVGTFWLARAYENTSYKLTVIPMAYSRAQAGYPPSVEEGYFVAETSDRIWFASLPRTDPKNPVNELREFPRSETDDLEIGQLTAPNQAEARAMTFVHNLCRRLKSLALAVRTQTQPKKATATQSLLLAGCT